MFFKEDIKFFYNRARKHAGSLYSDGHCLFKRYVLKNPIKTENKIFINRLYFEVTNICNLRCRFCVYSKKLPQKTGIMSFDIFKKTIDEFSELGGKIVSFTPTIGEPLLDLGLIRKIEYAHSLSSIKRVYFYTNGTLLFKNENYKKVVDSGITDMTISISAFDKEIFRKIGQSNLYEQTLEGIYKLLQYNLSQNEKIKIILGFRSPILPSRTLNSKDFQKYIKPYLSSKVYYSFMSSYDNWCGNVSKNDLVGIMKFKRINKFKYLPCIRVYDAVILFDGSVRLCAVRIKDSEFDELVVGNIRYNSLKEIFYSKKVNKIRESFLLGVVPSVCKNCSEYYPAREDFISNREKSSPLIIKH